MTQIKEMGYDGVELAGLYGIEPAEVKAILDKVGLIPVSAHVAFAEMMEDLDKVIEDYKTIGVKFLVMPYMAEEYRPVNPEGFESFLPLLNEVGAKIAAAGMTFLYHNHDFEFVKLPSGEYGYDKMFDSIPHANLQSELDTCWCDVATGQAPEFVLKYTDRIPVVHLKDYIKKGQPKNMYKLIGIDEEESADDDGSYFGFRPVGFGQMIWEPVLEASLKANAEWVVVEQDEHYELDPLECARRSREYLKILGW
jgi:sugar phosphate isomerase/epimerase